MSIASIEIDETSSLAESEMPIKCRVCLKDGDIPIFGEFDISIHVNEFGGIEVFEDDDNPQHVCDACHTLLEAAIMFRKTAQNSDQILKGTDFQKDSEDENTDYKQVLDKLLGTETYLAKEYVKYDEIIEDDDDEKTYTEEDVDDLNYKIDMDSDGDTARDNDLSVNRSEDKNIEVQLLNPDVNGAADAENEMIMIIVSDKNKNNSPCQTANIDCELCNLTFKSSEELKEHNTENHPQLQSNQKECEVCFKILNKNDYRMHLTKHREKYKLKVDKKYGKVECQICGKKVCQYYISHHLKLHGSKTEKAETMKECPICKKKFSGNYLSSHIQRIHRTGKHDKVIEKMLQCPVCDRKIKETIFQTHVAGHAGPTKRYVCDQCGKVFKYPSPFKTHCLTHGGELKYKCQFCPYRGLHKALLKIHVRTHTGDYNYRCTECPAKFITKSNLSKHLTQRHNGEYKFFCDVCHKGFYFKWELNKHHLKVHSGKKDNVCEICGKGYGHRDTMLSHQLKVHGRQKLINSRGRIASYMKLEQKTDLDGESI